MILFLFFLSPPVPSVIVGRDDVKSTLKIDQDFSAFQVATRHGLINGLAPENREKFNEIMNDVMSDKDNAERVTMLQGKIDELKIDPRNTKLVQYLDGEVKHLMNLKGIKPRFYNTEETKVR